MRILILSRYENLAASSRYRFYQYIPFLKDQGFDITIKPLLKNGYVEHLYYKTTYSLLSILKDYFARITDLLSQSKFDIIWLQQEVFPWMPYWMEKIFINSNSIIISDYDDAFFHRYDLHKLKIIRFLLGNKIDNVMKYSNLVLAGNKYLAKRAKLNNRRIEIFPTVVNTDIFKKLDIQSNTKFTIGWIGSPGTAKYLELLTEVFHSLGEKYPISLNLVGVNEFNAPTCNVNLIKWKEENEVQEINKFDVGIMPLPDTPWERGKCGFKLIQYLACEIPVIGSPVGVNKDIIKNGINGFQASSKEEWESAFINLIESKDLRKKMGIAGRKMIEEKYSLKMNSKKLLSIFSSFAKN